MADREEIVAPPRNDAYTGLLALSFLALVAATVLMVLDAEELGSPPPKLVIDVPGTAVGKAPEGLQRPGLTGKINTKIDDPPPPPPPEKKPDDGKMPDPPKMPDPNMMM